MYPIRSRNRQSGVTLIELMLFVGLSLVVVLVAGSIYSSVHRSYTMGAQKVVGGREAGYLSKVISRKVRVASGFVVYDVSDRRVPLDQGNGLALLDAAGDVMYRFEFDGAAKTLADSNGSRLTAMELADISFRADPSSLATLRFDYHAVGDMGGLVGFESAASLRN